ncbi:MAG: ComEC family competence protein [Clostridia bacterium]|nr:ComEC family competence protein [Clostridia bacterium]
MAKTRPLAVFSVMAFLFIILRLYYPVEPLLLFVFLIGLIAIFLNLKGKIDNFITCFLCASMLLGIFSANLKLQGIRRVSDMLDGQTVTIEGTVSSIPDYGKYKTTFFLDCEKVHSHNGVYNKNLKIYVNADKGPTFKFGDRLTFNADLKAAEITDARLGRHYLSKGAPLSANKLTLLKHEEQSLFHNVVAAARNYIISIGNQFFTGDARELFKALTAGDKSGFSNSLTSNLNRSGLSHIACVSGLHVSILGMAVYNLLRRKSRALSSVLAVIVVWVFSLITGCSPSTLRASIMFTSFIVAKMALMDNDGFTALSFSAMLLAIINPYVIYDWGFILSFLSVLGIQIFSFYFKNMLSFLTETLADSMSVTIAAQLMTIPAVTNMFGYLSVYSIPANIVVSAIFLWVLYLCFIFVAFSFVPGLNWLIGIVCAFGLDILAVVANLFADLPGSIMMVNRFDILEYIVYYTIVIMFVFRKKLSSYFISAVLFLFAVALVVTAIFPFSQTHKYGICDESVLYTRENKTALLAKDSFSEVEAYLAEADLYNAIDDYVVACGTENYERALVDMRNNVHRLHVSEKEKYSDFTAFAQKLGYKIEYYPEATEPEEYIFNVLE